MYAASFSSFFFFNDTATTEIYTLSLHDALPIWFSVWQPTKVERSLDKGDTPAPLVAKREEWYLQPDAHWHGFENLVDDRSEEHTSELQSQSNLVCRLLLEKKKKNKDRLRTTASP